jgi:H/ACA ribonucleoprotein complex subunit 2
MDALSTAANTYPVPSPGLVILSADISPIDVISHIPVTCEERGIPYMYVKSRLALGMAANTKRATSCVMITPGFAVKDKTGATIAEDYSPAFDSVSGMVRKENLAMTI